MMKVRLATFVLILTLGITSVPCPSEAADEAPVDANTACATSFAATSVDGDPSSVVVRILEPVRVPAGTLTAYGVAQTWTATVENTASSERSHSHEYSLTLHAPAKIEGVTFTPSWAPCTFYAGARPRNGYDGRDLPRPDLIAANAQPVEPATCARPYAPAAVKVAFEPTAVPGVSQSGRSWVSVAVALDEYGNSRFTRVIWADDRAMIDPSVDAARRTTYSPAVFRCKQVPSGYVFSVGY